MIFFSGQVLFQYLVRTRFDSSGGLGRLRGDSKGDSEPRDCREPDESSLVEEKLAPQSFKSFSTVTFNACFGACGLTLSVSLPNYRLVVNETSTYALDA